MEMRPIGWVKSDFQSKFGIPRQSGLVEELQARVFFSGIPDQRSLSGIRGIFSHLAFMGIFPKRAGKLVAHGASAPAGRQ